MEYENVIGIKVVHLGHETRETFDEAIEKYVDNNPYINMERFDDF